MDKRFMRLADVKKLFAAVAAKSKPGFDIKSIDQRRK
jgi:hypothetical protein